MKLLSDATTPFGRKVLVAAIERTIVLEESFVPLDGTGPLDQWNPLRQIPTLVLDDGRAIYDSDVIMDYLDTCHRAEPLIPKADRFDVLTRMALGNGLIEATLLRRLETVRAAGERSPSFIEKMEQRIERALRALDAQVQSLADSGTLRADQITAPSITLVQGDLATHAFADQSFDLVYSIGVLAERRETSFLSHAIWSAPSDPRPPAFKLSTLTRPTK